MNEPYDNSPNTSSTNDTLSPMFNTFDRPVAGPSFTGGNQFQGNTSHPQSNHGIDLSAGATINDPFLFIGNEAAMFTDSLVMETSPEYHHYRSAMNTGGELQSDIAAALPSLLSLGVAGGGPNNPPHASLYSPYPHPLVKTGMTEMPFPHHMNYMSSFQSHGKIPMPQSFVNMRPQMHAMSGPHDLAGSQPKSGGHDFGQNVFLYPYLGTHGDPMSGSNASLPFAGRELATMKEEGGKGTAESGKDGKQPQSSQEDDYFSLAALDMFSSGLEGNANDIDRARQGHQLQQQQQQQQQLVQDPQNGFYMLRNMPYLPIHPFMTFNNQHGLEGNPLYNPHLLSVTPGLIPANPLPPAGKRKPKGGGSGTPVVKGKPAKFEESFDEEEEDLSPVHSVERGAGSYSHMSHHSHDSHGHSAELAAAAMVTGTSIKGTSRANNSLSSLSRRFVEFYGDAKTIPYISGQLDENDYTGQGTPRSFPINHLFIDLIE